VNRRVAEFNRRYGFNASGWRDTRSRRQLLMGATLMTAPGAVAERVAAAVGYGSARAFHRALDAAGLPAPSAIAATVQSLA
jgi:chromate transport protein ChrA